MEEGRQRHLTDELQKQKTLKRQSAEDNLMQSHLKYKRYYDKKTIAAPLKVIDYCYALNPKVDNQSMNFAFKDCIWTGSYKDVNVLSNNNYVVRRTVTHKPFIEFVQGYTRPISEYLT